MSSIGKCKSYLHFFSKNISVYAIFNDQSLNDTLTNDIVTFEQLGPRVQMDLSKYLGKYGKKFYLDPNITLDISV